MIRPARAFALNPYFLATLACVATTVLTLPLLHVVDLANIVLLFVLTVVLIATFLGRGPAIAASVVAVALFDFFFVPPRFSFTVEQAQYLITFVVMLLVSLIISHLTNAYRDKAAEAEGRAAESAMLHDLAGLLAGAPTMADVAERLEQVAQRYLAASTTLYLAVDTPGGERLVPLQRTPPAAEQSAADTVYRNPSAVAQTVPDDDGQSTLHRLAGATRARGVLAVHSRTGCAPPRPDVLPAVAAVVATAIERIHFVDVAHETSLDVQTERLRGAILSALSHDLRTPLTVLYGLADSLAQRETLNPEDRATTVLLRDQSRRLNRMVDNLLDLARLRSGKVVLRRDWQLPAEIIGAAVQAMGPWLDSARVRMRGVAEAPLAEFDAVLMERVFCNVLENAVKYSPADTPIDIVAETVAEPAGDPRMLQITFSDRGSGFPDGDVDRLFSIFERAECESSIPGAGLGLAVCRAIVEAHGGRIHAANRPDGGASVVIALPLHDAPDIETEGAA